jgi:hypothetical protein
MIVIRIAIKNIILLLVSQVRFTVSDFSNSQGSSLVQQLTKQCLRDYLHTLLAVLGLLQQPRR